MGSPMDIMQWLRETAERWLYPDLGKVAPHHRGRAMQRAKSEPFDFLELACILAAVVAVTYLTRHSMKDPTAIDRLSAAAANFVVAVPQLLLLAGPFYIRRNRRGLRAFLAEQNSGRPL